MKHTTLQQARDKRGLTNADIGRAVGCSESMVQKVMSNARKRGKYREKIVALLTSSNSNNSKKENANAER